jgi:shikimate 5-dehydrogenase
LLTTASRRLENLKALVGRFSEAGTVFTFVCNDEPEENDRLLARLPPRSLVVNATGMGKDLPGSPLTGRAIFPEEGLAWELNYRGELDFMRQALAQSAARRLKVIDGWFYFLYGWAAITGYVFDVE